MYKLTRLSLLALPVSLLLSCQSATNVNSNTDTALSLNQLSTLSFPSVNSSDFSAHWLKPDLILLHSKAEKAWLVSSTNAQLDEDKQGQGTVLKPTSIPSDIAKKYPHLSDFHAYSISLPQHAVKSLLKTQLAVVTENAQGQREHMAYVQHYGVLDALYTQKNQDADELRYGAFVAKPTSSAHSAITFRLWAPTAKQVWVNVYSQDKRLLKQLALQEDSQTGAWSTTTEQVKLGDYYRYQIQQYHYQTQAIERIDVTDPYSLSLSTNSEYSQVVDLNSPETAPENWFSHQSPVLSHPEAQIIYETHVRDFSAAERALSNEKHRGKYKAFLDTNSFGAKHLKLLRESGLNVIHLLPTFDIGTVNEDPSQVIFLSDTLVKACEIVPQMGLCTETASYQTSLEEMLQRLDPLSANAQTIIEKIRQHDPYNWGYDPYHYTVPEGSYAVNPEGSARIVEFREMVQAIHEKGFRVVMDVVYNHTYEAGLKPKSVLDKVVPQYYHRLNPVSGAIEQSTCCDNTATEHRMMTKLMIDSLKVWAKDYKIDGFRFDLMGHQPKATMLAAREAVREIDPDTYFYGEGWNFGEVANHAQFEQSTQLALAGTEIGTFTDRLRDAVRGGSSFASGDDIRAGQGLGNGLYVYPNELQAGADASAVKHEYELSMDQARIGLTGNLANYPLITEDNQEKRGSDIAYGSAPTGYALDPADSINYVSKHDNQTLWDNNQYRIPFDATPEERVDFQLLSLAYPLYAQGIPFLHMGSELLRSKSFLRDSYDYNDWFNRVDYSMQYNNYAKGLPPSVKDKDNWPLIRRLLTNNEGRDKVTAEHIAAARSRVLDMIKIRSSSPLFSLPDEASILKRVSFHDHRKRDGLIVMQISDKAPLDNIDPNYEQILVIFNNTREDMTLSVRGVNHYQLHPILAKNPNTPKPRLLIGDVVLMKKLSVSVLVIPERKRLGN
ncbi:pullulanase-type alpha-1,6-glucosidase [Alteromonas sp. a30]|uniref:pullulanase-type alpha-1,6-glucosidase n=1 Tax=Alteromonas sp. a30 TaxID=2730917 RepID=UPI002280790E|nr:pullulanase-type alpha-1,6-glucosidase [Alteromonas sp. a30]MCY7296433.1 pullulanase-type alpha-1,6-glucosidase [Alteromonas sp. a30]